MPLHMLWDEGRFCHAQLYNTKQKLSTRLCFILMPSPSSKTSVVLPGSTGAREALKLLLSPEGKFFRDFITNEVVLSIDAMSRTQLVSLVERLGLSNIQIPILLPGAARTW